MNSKLSELIQAFSPTTSFDFTVFLCQLGAVALTSFLLALAYIRFGRSFSNRRNLALIFVPLALTTMFVIAVVKASLALSLGLVGALSIVRFRTAVREPEELVCLFVCIGIGLGYGATQWLITTFGFCSVVIYFFVCFLVRGKDRAQGYLLSLFAQGPPIDHLKIESIVTTHTKRAVMRRIDVNPQRTEIVFNVEISGKAAYIAMLDALRGAVPSLSVALVDQAGRGIE